MLLSNRALSLASSTVFAISLVACLCGGCTLAKSLTKEQVATYLSDAGYGIALGCYEEWLPEPLCTTGTRILSDASIAMSTAATGGWAAAAKAVLVVEENRLPLDSRLRPYLDALIPLL